MIQPQTRNWTRTHGYHRFAWYMMPLAKDETTVFGNQLIHLSERYQSENRWFSRGAELCKRWREFGARNFAIFYETSDDSTEQSQWTVFPTVKNHHIEHWCSERSWRTVCTPYRQVFSSIYSCQSKYCYQEEIRKESRCSKHFVPNCIIIGVVSQLVTAKSDNDCWKPSGNTMRTTRVAKFKRMWLRCASLVMNHVS